MCPYLILIAIIQVIIVMITMEESRKLTNTGIPQNSYNLDYKSTITKESTITHPETNLLHA